MTIPDEDCSLKQVNLEYATAAWRTWSVSQFLKKEAEKENTESPLRGRHPDPTGQKGPKRPGKRPLSV